MDHVALRLVALRLVALGLVDLGLVANADAGAGAALMADCIAAGAPAAVAVFLGELMGSLLA